jgi:hypothetical protein
MALKRVDFPTLGNPTMPALRDMTVLLSFFRRDYISKHPLRKGKARRKERFLSSPALKKETQPGLSKEKGRFGRTLGSALGMEKAKISCKSPMDSKK